MCGIVGYIGPKNATDVLLSGLRKLEYRGYDSAGVAVISGETISVARRQGKLDRLSQELAQNPVSGHVGIGHTRWATHGIPSDTNAHPHIDCTGRIVVVHNGIIENYLPLRERLEAEGHKFTSETDTEVLAHLIEAHFQGNLTEAVRAALREVVGSYALVTICQDNPDTIVAARLHSPLILGHGDGEQFVASDVPAILSYTRQVTYLDNGHIAEVTNNGVHITTLAGEEVASEVKTVHWDPLMAEKSGYKHYMLKEMHEQPTALAETLRGRLSENRASVRLPGFHLTSDELTQISKVVVIACGTAYHAGMVGKYAIERLARLPVEIDVASEWRYREPVVDEHTLAIVISQSGETADTLAGLRAAKEKGAHVLAITNVVGSSVDREADSVLYTYAGPEMAVASTKAYTTQLMVMYLIAIYLGEIRGILPTAERARLIDALQRLPDQAKQVLNEQEMVQDFSRRFHGVHSMLYLGRGVNFPTALEGALKLKEISYIHAEGYAAGEMKHGPIALITPDCPTVAIAMPGIVYDKIVSNIQEVKARRGHVIAVGADNDLGLAKYADDIIPVPHTEELFTP
ncbi:MAG TPA: glutamine--fructose-6-phosphate transaminase (isomerizing), partial [Armatimonadota bacterium]|nr:glutamine--fructose-6-phosphate transaminase (isomerizing) [Armatimonadota bacterium]